MTSKSSADQTVKERRLRPIYEFLDGGNNKRVVQEVDRLLKKQPDFSCAKVLKALALLRLGKPSESRDILDVVKLESPTDDNTVQAMIICYRELGLPNMVCELLETASKIEPSEDLLTNCFMAYVRVMDYKKQHQVALNLYKLYPKTPYFSWAIMSLFARVEFDSDPSSVLVSLPLASRMMAKFLEDSGIDSEHEVCLYLLILLKQGNFTKTLEIMDKCDEAVLSQDIKAKKIHCLQMTDQNDVLIDYLESSILESLDNWALYSDYVCRVGAASPDRVYEFLNQLPCPGGAAPMPRSTLLAYLYLYKCVAGQHCVPNFDVFEYLRNYASAYGSKPAFFMDLVNFFACLSTAELKTKCLNILYTEMCAAGLDYSKDKDIQADINLLYTRRYFNIGDRSGPHLLNLVESYISKYLLARDKQLEAGIVWPLKEGPHDEFINIAALELVDSFWNSSDAWSGIYSWLSTKTDVSDEEAVNSLCTSTQRNARIHETEGEIPQLENGENLTASRNENKASIRCVEDLKNNFVKCEYPLNNGQGIYSLDEKRIFSAPEEDFPLVLCLSLLHYGLDKSPTNSQMRILLGKTYMRCGAVGAGVEALSALDLKHIQLESIGYIYLWKLISLGHYEEGRSYLRTVDTFYSTFEKESMEHVLAAYKYGSWEKILEFMKFRQCLQNSLQCALVNIEKRLLQLVIDASDHKQLVAMVRKIDFNFQTMCLDNFDNLTDCRDLSVVLTFKHQASMEQWKNLSFLADKRKFKTRALILALATESILLADEEAPNSENTDRICAFENLVRLLQTELNNSVTQLPFEQVTVDGMWVSQLSQHLSSECTDLLLSVVTLFLDILKGCTPLNISERSLKFEQSLGKIMSYISRNGEQERRTSLYDGARYLETLSEVVQTLSLVCIFIDALCSVLKKCSSASLKLKKKKLQSATPSACENSIDNFISACAQALRNIDSCLLDFVENVNQKYPNAWDSMRPFWENKVSKDLLLDILPFSVPIVIAKIRASYSKSAAQMSHLIKSKIRFLVPLMKHRPEKS